VAQIHGNRDETANGEVVVFFDEGATDATLEAFCSSQESGCYAKGHPDEGGLAFVALPSLAEVSTISSDTHVSFVEYDPLPQDDVLSDIKEAAQFTQPWGPKRVGIPTYRGTGWGVNIYVLDSGVRVTHQDFGGRAIPTLDAYDRPPTVCNGDINCAKDNRGHGTHCAGSAAGRTLGVATQATIRVMQRGATMSDAYSSMDWLVRNVRFPAVLTMSFGTDGEYPGSRAATEAVINSGVTVTVSAGNKRIDACTKTFAFITGAIGVGSSTSSDARSGFSNFGKCITLFAPGSSIVSADYRSDDGLSTKSGTSMATPHVAGGAAIVLQGSPTLNCAGVKDRLVSLAEKGSLSEYDLRESPNILLRLT